MSKEKYSAMANRIGVIYYGLIEGKEYILERSSIHGMWNLFEDNEYVTTVRTDAFNDFKKVSNDAD